MLCSKGRVGSSPTSGTLSHSENGSHSVRKMGCDDRFAVVRPFFSARKSKHATSGARIGFHRCCLGGGIKT